MTTVGLITRIAIVAIAAAILTELFGWLSLPVVGLAYGFSDRRARARGTIAASGAAAGWVAILALASTRGAGVHVVAESVGALLHLPAWGFLLLTLAFAAMLCGTAAVIGAAWARTIRKAAAA